MQFGFRKGRRTINAVYTLKKTIGGEIAKEKGRVWGFLADMKAAFDKVKREEIWKKMEELYIEEGLRERIKKIYEDTRCEIEIGKKAIGAFRIEKGVRQGCPLSPTQHSIFGRGKRDEKSTGRRSEDRKEKNLSNILRRRCNTVSKQRYRNERDTEKF